MTKTLTEATFSLGGLMSGNVQMALYERSLVTGLYDIQHNEFIRGGFQIGVSAGNTLGFSRKICNPPVEDINK